MLLGEYIFVEVEDIGYGILFDVMEKIFDLFFFIKEVGKGIGFGLFIVYGIVK